MGRTGGCGSRPQNLLQKRFAFPVLYIGTHSKMLFINEMLFASQVCLKNHWTCVSLSSLLILKFETWVSSHSWPSGALSLCQERWVVKMSLSSVLWWSPISTIQNVLWIYMVWTHGIGAKKFSGSNDKFHTLRWPHLETDEFLHLHLALKLHKPRNLSFF